MAMSAGKAKSSERQTAPNHRESKTERLFNDIFASRGIALTANINSEGIESVVLVSQNTTSALSTDATEIKSLQTSVSGEELLSS